MKKLIKSYLAYAIIIINIILIFVHQFIINDDYFNISSMSQELLNELPKGHIYTFYKYFFELIETPIVQAIFLSLLFIIYIYVISLILLGIAKFTKCKVRFLKVTEAFVISGSVVIIKKVFEIIYTLVNGQVFESISVNFIFSLLQMIIYCVVIRFFVRSDKVNLIIYFGLIILGTLLINGIIVALNTI